MALTICAVPLGAAVLFFSITRILRLLRESEVARIDRTGLLRVRGRSPSRNI
jgi:hypothetical protein